MNIDTDKPKMIFMRIVNEHQLYSIGLSHKKQDGTYENGYMPCRFKKDVSLNDKTRIYIKDAWLDFYIKDKATIPYIFINAFEEINEESKEDTKEETVNEFSILNTKTDYNGEVELTDEDLPF